jgi:hypothetical protein
MPRIDVRAMLFAGVLCAVAAGCGGGGGGSSIVSGILPHGGSTASGTTATAILRIVIPAPGPTLLSSVRRQPQYISASTSQLAYSIDGTSQTPVSLSTSNPDCSGSPLSCSVPFNVAPGTHTFSFILEDSGGTPLSAASNISYTLTAGQTNTLSITLGGVPANVVMQTVSGNGSRVTGSQGNGFTVYGNASVQFTVDVTDADGNIMVGSGAPSPSVAPSAGAPFAIATPSPGSDVWTLTSSYQPTNPAVSSNTGLTIAVTPFPNSSPPASGIPPQTVQLVLFQPWIFVVNSGNGTITAYDEQGNQKTVSFTGLSTPLGIGLDARTSTPAPYAGATYVTNAGNNSVKVFAPVATATTVAGTFSGLASPGPIVFDSNDNQFYIANTAGSTALVAFDESGNAAAGFTAPTFVPTPTPVPTATAAPGWQQSAIAYDSADHIIFVASYLSTTYKVTAYTEAGAVQTSSSWTTALNQPSGLAYDPNSGWIYVANKGNNTITAYNSVGTQQTLSGFSGLSSPSAMLFDPYSKTFYVVNGNAMKAYSESGTAVTLSGTFPSLSTATSMVLLP